MTNRISRALVLSGGLALAACGDGSGVGVVGPGANLIINTSASDELNPRNALLIASIADRAVTRYFNYWQLTDAINNIAPNSTPPLLSRLPCPSGGQLQVVPVSPNAFDVTLVGCRTVFGLVLRSGVVGIHNFVRPVGQSSVSYSATPNAVQITDEGTDTVSGSTNYNFSVIRPNFSTVLIDNHNHSGQLDFSRAGRTDQYRNLNVNLSEVSGSQIANFSITISSLEISTPRVAVSKLLITTPVPITVSPPAGGIDGSVMAISSKDGSRVQLDYAPASIRLRSWNSRGTQTLDIIKNDIDPDVVAARNAAAS